MSILARFSTMIARVLNAAVLHHWRDNFHTKHTENDHRDEAESIDFPRSSENYYVVFLQGTNTADFLVDGRYVRCSSEIGRQTTAVADMQQPPRNFTL